MIKEITMPAGGQTTDTSMIGTWLVKKGDKVQRGDALLEIETDKATLTVESFAKGTVLALLAEPGDELPAGTVIAYVGEESDMAEVQAKLSGKTQQAAAPETDVAMDEEDEYQPIDRNAPARYVSQPEDTVEVVKTSKADLGDIKAMPNAKLIARENNVSLADVAAFAGKNILKRQDVNAYLESKKESGKVCETAANDTIVPLTKKRKVIAARMLQSTQNIPVFAATVEVEMTQCIAFRKLVNSGKDDVKISYNDILFKCMEAAIRKFPYVNSSFTDDAIILHGDVNIGLAVSVDDGLVVPVVRNVEKKNILTISEENKQNVEKARAGKLALEEMAGGTITLSNLGMYPITQFTAIINPPEVCILAIGATEDKPVLVDGAWKTVPVMKITGSFDHRVIDGAYGAQFLAELKKIIENPALALL